MFKKQITNRTKEERVRKRKRNKKEAKGKERNIYIESAEVKRYSRNKEVKKGMIVGQKLLRA